MLAKCPCLPCKLSSLLSGPPFQRDSFSYSHAFLMEFLQLSRMPFLASMQVPPVGLIFCSNSCFSLFLSSSLASNSCVLTLVTDRPVLLLCSHYFTSRFYSTSSSVTGGKIIDCYENNMCSISKILSSS